MGKGRRFRGPLAFGEHAAGAAMGLDQDERRFRETEAALVLG